jgi:MFS family permease
MPTVTRPPQSAAATLTLAAACLSMAAIAMSITASAVALAQVQADFGVGITELQWVQNGFILSFAALLLPFGSLADRIGQRPLFLLGTALFVLATLVSVSAPTFTVLMAGRLLQGVGGALMAATGSPALTIAFTDETDRKRAFGYLGASGGIGLTLGAFLAGAAMTWGGWRPAFAIHLPFAILALIAAWRGFAGSEGKKTGRFDIFGTICSCIFVTAAMAGGITGAEQGWTSPQVLALMGIAIAAGTAFAIVEARSPSPLISLAAFRNAQFLLACVVCLLFTTVWVALFIYVPLNLQTAQLRSGFDAGATLLALMVPALIMPMIVTRLIRRWPISAVLTIGFVLMSAGLLTLYFGWSGVLRRDLELTGLMLCGSGAGALYGLVDYLALTALPPQQSSIASGVFNLVRLMGDALGAIVPGAILLQKVRTAFVQNDVDVPRALLSEIAAGRFAAVERISADPQVNEALARIAATGFGSGIDYAVLTLCGISLAGAALTLVQRHRLEPRTMAQEPQGESCSVA